MQQQLELPEPSFDDCTLFDNPSLVETQTMTNPPKTGIDWKWWITTGIVIVGLIAGTIWTVAREFSQLDRHIGRIETAVRILGAKQGGDTKTLIDEALTVAKNASEAGRIDSAKAILDYANRLVEQQKLSSTPAPQQFFNDALTHYQTLRQSPALKEAAHAGTLKLAEYRTASIERPPNLSGQGCTSNNQTIHIGEMSRLGNLNYLKDSYFCGELAFGSQFGAGAIDGFFFDNVVFENMTITYHGGAVILRNVRFINCRFSVPDSGNGDQLLVAAIKQPANAQIG